MIVTKEHQEAMVEKYVKDKHTTDGCIGFIDGLNAALELVKNDVVLPDVRVRYFPRRRFVLVIMAQIVYRFKEKTEPKVKYSKINHKVAEAALAIRELAKLF